MNEENTQQRKYLRRLKPYQRIQLAFELHDMARARVAGEIKRRHPDLTNEELREKLNQRFMVRLAPSFDKLRTRPEQAKARRRPPLAHHRKQFRKDPVR